MQPLYMYLCPPGLMSISTAFMKRTLAAHLLRPYVTIGNFKFTFVVMTFQYSFLFLFPNFFLHISFSWVEIRLHTECQLPMVLRSGSFMVGETTKRPKKVSMKLMASLAPARAEVEAGVVAKADQKSVMESQCHTDFGKVLGLFPRCLIHKPKFCGFIVICDICFQPLQTFSSLT